MNRARLSGLFVLAALALGACQPTGAYSGTLVLEGRHNYDSGRTLEGAFIMLDGRVRLERGARVTGPVFLLGGELEVAGRVDGDVSAIGGVLIVGPTADLGGNLRVGGGELDLSPRAEVAGQTLTGAASGARPEDLFPRRSLREGIVRAVISALLLAKYASLAARFFPRSLDRVARAARSEPLAAAAMGLLAGVVGLTLWVVLAFTLILIPVALIGLLIGFLAIGYGWTALGTVLGRTLAGRARSVPQRAFWGTLVFGLVLNLLALLPYVGGLIALTAAAYSLGAVMLTRFGLREFVPAGSRLI